MIACVAFVAALIYVLGDEGRDASDPARDGSGGVAPASVEALPPHDGPSASRAPHQAPLAAAPADPQGPANPRPAAGARAPTAPTQDNSNASAGATAPPLAHEMAVPSDNQVPSDAPSRFPADSDALIDGIRSGFGDLRPQLRECYELLLALAPDAEDRLIFGLRVSGAGPDVETGVIELESINTDTLEIEDTACFAEVIDELVLPAPEGGTGFYSVRYPVVLNAGDPE